MFYYILLCFTIFYYILLYFTIVYYVLLYFTIVYYILLYFTIFYYILLYFTIVYYTYFTILYYILLYILLYFTIFYYILLYFTIFYYIRPHVAGTVAQGRQMSTRKHLATFVDIRGDMGPYILLYFICFLLRKVARLQVKRLRGLFVNTSSSI